MPEDRKTSRSTKATYKIPEAAKVAGCGPLQIRKRVAAGQIPHIRFGRQVVIPKKAFEIWLNSAGEVQN